MEAVSPEAWPTLIDDFRSVISRVRRSVRKGRSAKNRHSVHREVVTICYSSIISSLEKSPRSSHRKK